MVNKRLAGWERRRIDGSAGLEIGAWRDPTSVEFDKNATVSEVRNSAIFPLLYAGAPS